MAAMTVARLLLFLFLKEVVILSADLQETWRRVWSGRSKGFNVVGWEVSVCVKRH